MKKLLRPFWTFCTFFALLQFSFAATPTYLMINPVYQPQTINGLLPGGKLYTCTPGTTCGPTSTTLKDTYTDSTGATPNANPVVLDANGSATIWLNGTYKIALYDAAGNSIYTQDNISSIVNPTTYGTDAVTLGLAATVAALGATQATIVVTTTQVITANLTIPSNISLWVISPGQISVNSGKTVTINGPFSSGSYQVFSGLGTVTFGMPPVSGVMPEWWQTNTSPGTTDMAAATQSAINSVSRIPYANGHASGAQVVLTGSAYLWGSTIDMTERDTITLAGKGNGYLGPNITSTSTGYIIDMTSALMCRLENLHITSNTAKVGIFQNRGTGNPYSFWQNFHNLYVHLGTQPGINGGIGSIALYNCRSENTQYHNCLFEGDVGVYANITPDLVHFPSTFTTVDNTIHSMEMVSFYDCTIRSLGTYNYPEILTGVLGFYHHNCVWAQAGDSAGTSGTANGAVYTNEISHSSFTGQTETIAGPFAYVHAGCYNSTFDIITASSMWTTAGLINLDSASSYFVGNNVKMEISGTPLVIVPVVNQRNASAVIAGNHIISTSGSNYVHTIDATAGARTPQYPSLIANVNNNIEETYATGTTTGKIIVDNVRKFSVLGAAVTNGVSFVYYPPDNVGMVKITAVHYGLSGGECENLVVMGTRLGDATVVGIVPLVDEIVGTANRLVASYSGGPPKAIIFTTSANTGNVYIWYTIEEVYGSTS